MYFAGRLTTHLDVYIYCLYKLTHHVLLLVSIETTNTWSVIGKWFDSRRSKLKQNKAKYKSNRSGWKNRDNYLPLVSQYSLNPEVLGLLFRQVPCFDRICSGSDIKWAFVTLLFSNFNSDGFYGDFIRLWWWRRRRIRSKSYPNSWTNQRDRKAWYEWRGTVLLIFSLLHLLFCTFIV